MWWWGWWTWRWTRWLIRWPTWRGKNCQGSWNCQGNKNCQRSEKGLMAFRLCRCFIVETTQLNVWQMPTQTQRDTCVFLLFPWRCWRLALSARLWQELGNRLFDAPRLQGVPTNHQRASHPNAKLPPEYFSKIIIEIGYIQYMMVNLAAFLREQRKIKIKENHTSQAYIFAFFCKFGVFCLWEPFRHHLSLITSYCRLDQKTDTDLS